MTSKDLADRFLNLGLSVIKISEEMNSSIASRIIQKQVIRSASSVGANYQEAIAAHSRKDFIYKVQIVLKELRETQYWLVVIERAGLMETKDKINPLISICDELIRIVSKTVITAKANGR